MIQQQIHKRTAVAAVLLAFLLGGLVGVKADNLYRLVRYVETKTAPAISSNAVTINLSNGTHFQVTVNATLSTITFTNPPPTGYASTFTLALTQDGSGGHSIAGWPASVKWPAGSVPTFTTTASKTDLVSFVTYDGGTTWWAILIGQSF